MVFSSRWYLLFAAIIFVFLVCGIFLIIRSAFPSFYIRNAPFAVDVLRVLENKAGGKSRHPWEKDYIESNNCIDAFVDRVKANHGADYLIYNDLAASNSYLSDTAKSALIVIEKERRQ